MSFDFILSSSQTGVIHTWPLQGTFYCFTVYFCFVMFVYFIFFSLLFYDLPNSILGQTFLHSCFVAFLLSFLCNLLLSFSRTEQMGQKDVIDKEKRKTKKKKKEKRSIYLHVTNTIYLPDDQFVLSSKFILIVIRNDIYQCIWFQE